MMKSPDDMVRELLTLAVREGLVALPPAGRFTDPRPAARTGAELVLVGDLLLEYIRQWTLTAC